MNRDLHRLLKKATEAGHIYKAIAAATGMTIPTIGRWVLEEEREDYRAKKTDARAEDALRALLGDTTYGRQDNESLIQTVQDGDTKLDHYRDADRQQEIIAGTVGGRMITIDEVFERFGLVRDEWEIKELTVTPFSSGMKMDATVVGPDGETYTRTEPHQQESYSFRMKLKPSHEVIEKSRALEALIARIKEESPKVPIDRIDVHGRPHLAILAPTDLHLGKLSFDGKWTIDTARAAHDKAIAYMLDHIKDLNIERIAYLVGSDLLHVDSPDGTTTSGTQVSRNASWENQFDAGCQMAIDTITMLLQIAPVDVMVVRGNHDRNSCYGVARVIEARFYNEEDVSVDVDDIGRSVLMYGNNFILATHGDRSKPDRAAMSMAITYPDEWAASKNGSRSHLSGHYHKAMGGKFVSGWNDELGVETRTLPALCNSDHWHVSRDFIGAMKAAQCLVYDKEWGICRVVQYNAGR